ncbi:MAG: hypothetical protein ACRDZX_02805 [Acidimicrobiales bacterium]
MTYQLRGRRWLAGGCGALVAVAATMAGTLVPAAPALAGSNAGTTTGASAAASTPTSSITDVNRLNLIKTESARLIARRVASLQAAEQVVGAKAFLGSDGTAVATGMQDDISGLEALGAKIQADTILSQARQDRDLIYTQFRVYYLVLPVATNVIDVDFSSNVGVTGMDQDITQLQGYVNTANQGVLGPIVTGMADQVHIATTATAGLSAQLLSYTPAEWNANHRLLANAGVDIRTADRALQVAGNDLARADRYLRQGVAGGQAPKAQPDLGRKGHGPKR